MAFMKKIFGRSYSSKSSNFSVESPKMTMPRDSLMYLNDYEPTLSDATSESILRTSKCDGYGSLSPKSIESGPTVATSSSESDVELRNTRRKKSHKLNKAMKEYSKMHKRLDRKQRDVLAMQAEIEELDRMIRLAKIQTKALDFEKDRLKNEMTLICNSIPTSEESEIRKREPVLFRKYSHIKNPGDAKNIVISIKQKQKALQNLEVLTYKKYMGITHGIKLVDKEKETKSGPRTKKTSFEKMFFDAINVGRAVEIKSNASADDAISDDDVAVEDTNNSTLNASNGGFQYRQMFEITPVTPV